MTVEDEKKPLFFNEGSHSEYSDDTLEEMKLMGMKKPDSVEWGRWVGPKDHSHRHELLVHLAASGLTNNAIAKELEMTPSRISIILTQPEIKNKIRKVQDTLWGENATARFEKLIPAAIDTLEDITKNKQEKSSTRVSAANSLLDRALGKPQQTIDVTGNLLGEVVSKLDKLRIVEGQASDVTELEKDKDKLDTFLEEFIPEKHVVGKRGESDEQKS